MSPKIIPHIVGLAAPGLLWLATSVAFGQELPSAPPGPTTPPPIASGSTPKAFRALLLSNGKVIRGDIVEEASAGLYRLRQNGGVVGYPKFKVLAAGDSVEDLYRFQVARLPKGDFDERMKLARWCLTEHLVPQAKEQLEAIQKISPEDTEVEHMLFNLASAPERRPIDDGILRTSGEVTQGDAPGSLDPRFINKVGKKFNSLPEILDLPQAQAVNRANEFADYVHPVLQQNCVKCHNEKYQGDFQLVAVRIRKDLTNPDIARANLDATLRLINPDDPARSPLLSAGLVPHGGSKNSIFRGPNDKNYQILAQWAKSLRPSARGASGPVGSRGLGDGVSRSIYAPVDTASGQGFASERAGRPGSNSVMGAEPLEKVPSGTVFPPPRAIVERYDESAVFVNAAGDNPQFPQPYQIGGAPIPRPAPPKAKAAGSKANIPGAQAGLPPLPEAVSKKAAVQAGPRAARFEATDDPNELPGMDLPRYPPKADKDDEADPKKKPKPIDNAQLEKLLKTRNGGTP